MVRINEASPGADPTVKTMILQKYMAMVGCGSPPIALPHSTVTDCQWIGGVFTCTTD